jgi:hypothetical protein
MANKDYIPESDRKFLTWVKIFFTGVVETFEAAYANAGKLSPVFRPIINGDIRI